MSSFTMNIFTWISLISGILGMALNLLLIPVILYYSQKSMGRYKYLMLAYTVAAILYTAAQVIALPTYFLFDSGFVLCSTASHSSTIINMAGLFVFCSTFALVEIIVCLSFLYRYGVMCNERVLQYFKPGLKLLQMVLLSFVSWIVPSLLFASLKPNPLVMEYIDKAEKEVREQIINLTCLGGPVFLWSGEIYRPMLYALAGFVVLTVVTIAIDIFCLVKIKRLFRTIAVNSHVKRQKELLTLLLFVQLILPIIFNGTPSALMIVFTLLKVNPGAAPQYIGAVMSIAQICDPLLVIGFVGNYRRAMYRLVRLKVMKITSVEASGSRLRTDRTSERTRSRTNVV